MRLRHMPLLCNRVQQSQDAVAFASCLLSTSRHGGAGDAKLRLQTNGTHRDLVSSSRDFSWRHAVVVAVAGGHSRLAICCFGKGEAW